MPFGDRSGGRADIGLRHVEGEGAAFAGRAAELNFAAEEAGKFAADGEAKPGASVFAAGAGIGLLEGLEYDALLLGGNTDTGIGDLEGDDGARAGEDGVVGTPAGQRTGDGEANAALLSELEGVGQQVFEDLLEAARIGDETATEPWIALDLEEESAVFGLVAERPGNGFEERAEEELFRLDRNRAGFDLGEVENIGDEVEEVGAGAVNGAGEFNLTAGEIAVGVFCQLLTEHKDGVERRAQLVRHVGQEFGFVL